MDAIMNYQREFFTGDQTVLRPMILKDIAEIDRARHFPTVSHVANSKFVQTEFGTYRLKFSSANRSAPTAGRVKYPRGKKILSDLIEGEDKRKPLSDERLTELLQEKGYNIARRTVAKYREQLNIPVARLRKEL